MYTNEEYQAMIKEAERALNLIEVIRYENDLTEQLYQIQNRRLNNIKHDFDRHLDAQERAEQKAKELAESIKSGGMVNLGTEEL